MRNSTRIFSIVGLGMLMSSVAWAQEAAPPAAATPAPAPSAPAAPAEAAPATPAAAETMPATGEQVAQAETEVAPAEMSATAEVAAEPAPMEEAPVMEEAPADQAAAADEEEESTPAWFRMDSDGLGLQLWFGATHDLGGIGLATDIYVDSGTLAEFDIGVELPIGESVLLIPMVGIGFNWAQKRPATLVAPQLFAYLDFSPVYIEYWGQFFFNSPLASDDVVVDDDSMLTEKDVAQDTMYNRLQLFFNISETVALGPQVEATIALNDAAGDGVTSLPVGLGTNIGYGEGNTLGLWLAYETKEDARLQAGPDTERGIVGRFTFLKTW